MFFAQHLQLLAAQAAVRDRVREDAAATSPRARRAGAGLREARHRACASTASPTRARRRGALDDPRPLRADAAQQTCARRTRELGTRSTSSSAGRARDAARCPRRTQLDAAVRAPTLALHLLLAPWRRKPPRRTRERILETSLALFNRYGEPHVTTADIADEMNISPGNLVLPLPQQGRHHRRALRRVRGDGRAAARGARGPRADVEDLWLLLHLLFERMREYRFLYRDLDEITSRNRKLAAALRRPPAAPRKHRDRVVRAAWCATGRCAQASARSGALAATPRSCRRTGCRGSAWEAPRARRRGRISTVAAYHVLALFAPVLVGDGRALIERLGEDYL